MGATYPAGKHAAMTKKVDVIGEPVKAALVGVGYVYDKAHAAFADVSAYAVGTPLTLAGKALVDGAFDAADVEFPAVTGADVAAIVVYAEPTAGGTVLLAHLDGWAPIPTNGGPIAVSWSNGERRIFRY